MKFKLILLAFSIFSLSFITERLATVDTEGMVLIKGGTYTKGIDSTTLRAYMNRFNAPADAFSQEYPTYRVTVAPFYIDKKEVTNAEYKKFIAANKQWSKTHIPDSLHNGYYLRNWSNDTYPKGEDDFPVVYINWYAANAYAHWKGKRLPMEAEWEYAAKGGQDKKDFPWGNADAEMAKANYRESGIRHGTIVGTYEPPTSGIYDMAGNVAEICLDRWRAHSYAEHNNSIKSINSTVNSADINKVVIRGGSWQSTPLELRTTHREAGSIKDCNAVTGFRCAASASFNKQN